MIIDKIENAHLYKGLGKRINVGLNYLQSTNLSNLEEGKHLIDNEDVFAIINEYETKVDDIGNNYLEGHKKYIDIQYICDGTEQIGLTTFKNQKAIKEYVANDDYQLFEENYSLVTLTEGMFAIFFPDDLHLPGIKSEKINTVKKIVIKVKI